MQVFYFSIVIYLVYISGARNAKWNNLKYLDANTNVKCSWNGELMGLRRLMYRKAC